MCRELAITQVANGRSFNFMFRVTMGIAKRWKWDKLKAKKLANNLQAYHQSVAPFAGAQADGLLWWKNLPINTETYPLKAFAIMIHSIIGHAGDVEQLFSDLGTTQSVKRCNLSVETFETLGKIRANLCYLCDKKATEADKSTRRHHAHMHTREETGINLEVARDLEENFAWVPPLAAEPANLDDSLAGPESLWPDDVAAEFAAFEKQAREETFESVDGKEVFEGCAFDFKELLCVDQGIIPRAAADEINVVDHDGDGEDSWDEQMIIESLGLSFE
jgi:hypothetical protein